MTASETRTYRTLPARIIGWTILVVAGGIAVGLGLMEASIDNNPLSPAAFLGVVAAIVWVVLLRPCVRLASDRVEMSNLVTDVTVSFSQLREVEHVWALELIDNAGTKHSSWAIPVRREFRRRSTIDGYAVATQRGKPHEGNTAEAIAGHVLTAVQRWKLAGGVEDPGQGAQRTPAWGALLPFLVAVLFLVVVQVIG